MNENASKCRAKSCVSLKKNQSDDQPNLNIKSYTKFVFFFTHKRNTELLLSHRNPVMIAIHRLTGAINIYCTKISKEN